MEDILQLRLSRRVISKGQARRRSGRLRSEKEAIADAQGQPSSGESIRDSQIINRNKLIIANNDSPASSDGKSSPQD
ncbi:hypothetical protein Ancab_002221, partial [Ancistrocladus abbreviatus]